MELVEELHRHMLKWADRVGMRPEDQADKPWEHVWWPSKASLVREALRMLEAGPGDVLLDLGAGDLRASVMALDEFNVDECIAVDVNHQVMKEALRFLKANGFDKLSRLTALRADAWTVLPSLAKTATKALFLAWRVNPQRALELVEKLPRAQAVVHNFGDPDTLTLTLLEKHGHEAREAATAPLREA